VVLSNIRRQQAALLPWPVTALAQGQGPERTGVKREATNTFERAGIIHHDGLASLI
jgi:hypothetical protein